MAKNISIYLTDGNLDCIKKIKHIYKEKYGINLTQTKMFQYSLLILNEYLDKSDLDPTEEKLKYLDFINDCREVSTLDTAIVSVITGNS